MSTLECSPTFLTLHEKFLSISALQQRCEQNTLPAPSAVNQQGALDVVQRGSALLAAKAFKNTLNSSSRISRYFSQFTGSDSHSMESWSTPADKHQLIVQCQKTPLYLFTYWRSSWIHRICKILETDTWHSCFIQCPVLYVMCFISAYFPWPTWKL